MKPNYSDILAKAGEPTWWDEHGVPRYCEFDPYKAGNTIAQDIALILIECQRCHKQFKVSVSSSLYHKQTSIENKILTKQLYYGDPPDSNCCPTGPTMSSETIRVLEYWRTERCKTNRMPVFKRYPKLEIEIGISHWSINNLYNVVL